MKKAFVTVAAAAAILATGFAATAQDRMIMRQAVQDNATTLQPVMPSSRATVGLAQAQTALVSIAFHCEVSGTPVEFPNDIVLRRAVGATAAGTSVAWNAPGFSGQVTLPALAAGEYYFVANALPGGLPAGTPCSAAVN